MYDYERKCKFLIYYGKDGKLNIIAIFGISLYKNKFLIDNSATMN